MIEGEPELVKVLRSYFEHSGFSVLISDRRYTGLSNWKHQQPDLVILDLNFPGLDGLDVVRKIHSNGNTPIVMLTA